VNRYNRMGSWWWRFSTGVTVNRVEVIIKEIWFSLRCSDWVYVIFVSLDSQ